MATGDVSTTSGPESATSIASGGDPGLAVGIGVDVEAEVISLGLIAASSEDFRVGYAAYWDAQNAGAGVGGFSVEVVEFSSAEDASESDVAAASIAGTRPDGEGDLALVGDLIAPAPGDVVAVASTFPTLLDGVDIVGYDIVIDSRSPTQCREPAPGRTVIEAGEAAIEDAAIVVLCTNPQTANELIEAGGDWTAVAVVAWSWDPIAATLAGDRPLVIVGSTPGPGVDDAPAGEIVPLSLDEDRWTFDMFAGYTAALSLHAVLELAMRGGDVRRAAISAAIEEAAGLDLGFGPQGIAIGQADLASPTGVLVVEWRTQA